MIKVYTDNGEFIITEALYESIKANNPEILVERDLYLNPSETISLLKDIYTKTAVPDWDRVSNILDSNYDQLRNKSDEDVLIFVAKELGLSDPLGMINPTSQQAAEKIETIQSAEPIKSSEDGQKAKNNNKKIKNTDRLDDSDDGRGERYSSIKECLEDKELMTDIAKSIKLSKRLVELCSKSVQRALGIYGNVALTNPKNDIQTIDRKDSTNDEQKTDGSNDSQEETLRNKTMQHNQDIIDGKLKQKVNKTQLFKSYAGLMLDGFRIAPMTFNIDDERIGNIISRYRQTLKFRVIPGKLAPIIKMINTYLYYRNKKTSEKDIPKDVNKDEFVKLTRLCRTYILSIWYKMDVMNEKEYSKITGIVRTDPRISEYYSVTNDVEFKILGAQGSAVSFSRRGDYPIIDLILNIEPTFTTLRQLAPKVKGMWDVIKQHNRT